MGWSWVKNAKSTLEKKVIREYLIDYDSKSVSYHNFEAEALSLHLTVILLLSISTYYQHALQRQALGGFVKFERKLVGMQITSIFIILNRFLK